MIDAMDKVDADELAEESNTDELCNSQPTKKSRKRKRPCCPCGKAKKRSKLFFCYGPNCTSEWVHLECSEVKEESGQYFYCSVKCKEDDLAAIIFNEQIDKEEKQLEFANLDDYPWCTCKKRTGGTLIECSRKKCKVQWYHYKCVNLEKIPKGPWICSSCKEIATIKKKMKAEEFPILEEAVVDCSDVPSPEITDEDKANESQMENLLAVANKNMEERLTKMKTAESELKLKNAELEQKMEENQKKFEAEKSTFNAKIESFEKENEANEIRIEDLKRMLSTAKDSKKNTEIELRTEIAEIEKQRKALQTEIYKQKAIVEGRNKKITELNTVIRNQENIETDLDSIFNELEANYEAALEREMELKNREINRLKEKVKKMEEETKQRKSENGIPKQNNQNVVALLPPKAVKRGRPRKSILPPPNEIQDVIVLEENENEALQPSAKKGRPKKVIFSP